VVRAVRVVLDQDEAPARRQVRAHEREDRRLVLHEVQRVRHQHAVHAAEAERAREVGRPLVKAHRAEPCADRRSLRRERAAVLIDRVDRAAAPEKIRERQGERARARSELEPGLARLDGVADERDVIGVIYGAMSVRARLRA